MKDEDFINHGIGGMHPAAKNPHRVADTEKWQAMFRNYELNNHIDSIMDANVSERRKRN